MVLLRDEKGEAAERPGNLSDLSDSYVIAHDQPTSSPPRAIATKNKDDACKMMFIAYHSTSMTLYLAT